MIVPTYSILGKSFFLRADDTSTSLQGEHPLFLPPSHWKQTLWALSFLRLEEDDDDDLEEEHVTKVRWGG